MSESFEVKHPGCSVCLGLVEWARTACRESDTGTWTASKRGRWTARRAIDRRSHWGKYTFVPESRWEVMHGGLFQNFPTMP